MKLQTAPSALWRGIQKSEITASAVRDLSAFKSSSVNFRLALWDPATNGGRYLKALLYSQCQLLGDGEERALRRTRGRELGRPITVRWRGLDVCMDYLQSALEHSFVAPRVRLDGAEVLEIGAGYGRTPHLFVSNADVKRYTIVDLDNCLALSRRYLEAVLPPAKFRRMRFVPASRAGDLAGERFDLAVNVDSFAEMEAETVRSYLGLIARTSRALFVKNPVGKYLDPSLESRSRKKHLPIALRMGLLTQVLDIHDDRQVRAHARRFVRAYRPRGMRLAADGWARPWSFYWQALYRR